jgi:hypothetical protein
MTGTTYLLLELLPVCLVARAADVAIPRAGRRVDAALATLEL